MKSIWTKNPQIDHFPTFKGEAKTDVLIIGGGMAGILCAYFLEQNNIDYILVEGDTIGSGITQNTTAKITAQHGLIYQKLITQRGTDTAKRYLDANQLAIRQFKELCAEIPCDFEQKDAFVYSRSNQEAIEREIAALNKLNFKPEFVQTTPLPFEIAGAIRFANQAQFNPLKFIAGISKNLNIYEHTVVREIGDNYAATSCGQIAAQKIIIATHFPIINTHGAYFLKMYQHRSYAIALKNAPNLDGMYLEAKTNGLSFRNYKDMMLIGGGGHKTGKQGGNWKVIREFAKDVYPGAVEKYAWATQDCMTLDHVPYIGPYSKSCKTIYVATGFNKWGMTSSMAAALLLTDMIKGTDNAFAPVFSPSRSMLTPQLALNGINAITNLLRFGQKRCPHLGCVLQWNRIEHSWDCPCHGSRFDKSGKLLDNPATGGLKK